MCSSPGVQENQKASTLPLRSSVVQRLQRFATYGHLKQLVLRMIADEMGDGRVTDVKSQVGPHPNSHSRRRQTCQTCAGCLRRRLPAWKHSASHPMQCLVDGNWGCLMCGKSPAATLTVVVCHA